VSSRGVETRGVEIRYNGKTPRVVETELGELSKTAGGVIFI